MKLEESVKQGLLHNTQQSVAEYDQGIENIHNSIASLDNMNVVERKMLAMLDKYGAEPGFEQALRALDPDTVSAKLINAKVVPDRQLDGMRLVHTGIHDRSARRRAALLRRFDRVDLRVHS